MRKKTVKVNNKKVKFKKKKKVIKKKTVKKKVIKRKKKKVVKKKKRNKRKINKKKVVRKKRKSKKKRKRRKKFLMKDLYPILNKVQLKRKTITFVTELIEAAIVENTIKDLELVYSKKEMKTQVEFTVRPNKENIFKNEEELLDIEYLDDEIPELDQIF